MNGLISEPIEKDWKMATRVEKDQYTRWWVEGDELHASFADYVVFIKPDTRMKFPHDAGIVYLITFSKGAGYPWIKPIKKDTLEEAIQFVHEYEDQKKYDQLMDALIKDGYLEK